MGPSTHQSHDRESYSVGVDGRSALVVCVDDRAEAHGNCRASEPQQSVVRSISSDLRVQRPAALIKDVDVGITLDRASNCHGSSPSFSASDWNDGHDSSVVELSIGLN
jgi:hypothetical protein